jgi:protein SCO1/2
MGRRTKQDLRGRLLGLLVACWALAACGEAAPSFRGSVLPEPLPATDFSLTDQHCRPFLLSDQRGNVVLLFFGYTHCPDVCPTTLVTWKQLHEALGEDASQVRFVFVTVDPERDTPERLGVHVNLFNPEFVGLTGPQEALEPVYQAYGVYHAKVPVPESAAGYLVDHTASTYVIDPDGRWRMRFPYETSVEDMAHDIRLLLR